MHRASLWFPSSYLSVVSSSRQYSRSAALVKTLAYQYKGKDKYKPQSSVITNVTNVTDVQLCTYKYNYVVQRLREFCVKRGMLECNTQHRLSILAACEDPRTISVFKFAGQRYPLPQTGQMWLEWEMLKKPSAAGFFCVSTSYRNEPNPVPGRHLRTFPMFEFELPGNLIDLLKFEAGLLRFLGYDKKQHCIAQYEYKDIATRLKATDISHEEEQRIMNELGHEVCSITNFPESTEPFWNMKRTKCVTTGESTANKVDVILSGMETIGSAERETDTDKMRHRFSTISGGEYAKLLYSKFGVRRVQHELEEFLQLPFVPRYGGGIGITRLISSMDRLKLIPPAPPSWRQVD